MPLPWLRPSLGDDTLNPREVRYGEVLDRVRNRGERYTVERDGQPVALLTPPVPKPFTVADFLDLWERIPHPDDAFGDEVEATQAAQG